MQPIRYGILSTSSVAPRFIAGVRAADAGEVVALSSRSLDKAREKAAEWGIPRAYGGHMELLEDEDVNVVYISTVNALHFQWAKAALEHGKHVVCEKPCTTSERDTRALAALAREKGLFFMEANKMLFLPAVRAVRDRVARGELGAIHMASFSHSFPASYNGWMFDASAGGGTLLSSGIYVMGLLLWLFGPIRTCGGVRTCVENGMECQYVLAGEMENGVLFSAHNSTLAPLRDGLTLYGEKGSVFLPDYWKARRAVFRPSDGPEKTIEFACDHEMAYEAGHIRDCIDMGRCESPVVTWELSAAAIRALEQVRGSWRYTNFKLNTLGLV